MPKYVRKQTQERLMKKSAESNVVQLRKSLSDLDLTNIENAIQLATKIRTDLSDDLTEVIMESIIGLLIPYGINIEDTSKNDPRDYILIEQAITSALYRHYGLEHPLQEVAEEMFEISEEEMK